MAATPPTTGIAARTVAPAAIPPPPAASAPPPSHAVAAFVAAHPVSVLIAVPVEAVPNVVAIPIAAACPPRTVAVPVAIPAPLLILSDVFIFFYFFDTANLDAFDEYFFSSATICCLLYHFDFNAAKIFHYSEYSFRITYGCSSFFIICTTVV